MGNNETHITSGQINATMTGSLSTSVSGNVVNVNTSISGNVLSLENSNSNTNFGTISTSGTTVFTGIVDVSNGSGGTQLPDIPTPQGVSLNGLWVSGQFIPGLIGGIGDNAPSLEPGVPIYNNKGYQYNGSPGFYLRISNLNQISVLSSTVSGAKLGYFGIRNNNTTNEIRTITSNI